MEALGPDSLCGPGDSAAHGHPLPSQAPWPGLGALRRPPRCLLACPSQQDAWSLKLFPARLWAALPSPRRHSAIDFAVGMRLCSGGGHHCGGDGCPCVRAVLPRQGQRAALVPAHGCSWRCRHHILHHHPQVRHSLAARAFPPSCSLAVAQISAPLFPSRPLPISQCHARYAHSMRGTCTKIFMRSPGL